jgi:hypothetical protein
MKKLIFILCFFPLFLLGQTPQPLQGDYQLVGEGTGSTTVNDSTFRLTIEFNSDQYNSGYLPTQIQTGYRMLDSKGHAFRVTVVNSSNFVQANVDVVRDTSTYTAPAGIVMIWKELASGLIPQYPQNASGLSPLMAAYIQRNNFARLRAGSGVDSLTAVSRAITIHTGSEDFSFNTVDTVLQIGGQPVIIIGTDTIPVPVPFGKVLFVSSDGNDATGLKGSISFPWATLDSAYANATSNDYLAILPGDTVVVNSTVQMLDKDFNLIMFPGAVLEKSAASYLLNLSGITDRKVNILGPSAKVMDDGGYLIQSNSTQSKVDIFVDVGIMSSCNFSFAYKNREVKEQYNVKLCEGRNTCSFYAGTADVSGQSQAEDKNVLINIDQVYVVDSIANNGQGIFRPFYSGFSGMVRSDVSVNINQAYIENKHVDGGGIQVYFFNESDDHGTPHDINYAINFGYLQVKLAAEYIQHYPSDPNNPAYQFMTFRGEQYNAKFSVHADEAIIIGQSIANDHRGDGNLSDSTELIFSGNWEFKNAIPFDPRQGNTRNCNTCVMTFDGNFKVDSTFARFDLDMNFDVTFRGEIETTGSNGPIILTDDSYSRPFYFNNVRFLNKGNHPIIQGQTNDVYLEGDVTYNQDTIDQSLNYIWVNNLGENSIISRLLFDDVVVDGGDKTKDVRFTNLDQWSVSANKSIAHVSDSSDIIYTALLGEFRINSQDLRVQGDSLTALNPQTGQVGGTGTGFSEDDIEQVAVMRPDGLVKFTTTLLPRWDTLSVTTANDTIDLEWHYDNVIFIDMTSAPATVNIEVENAHTFAFMHWVFYGVGSTHTINFTHEDIEGNTPSSFTVGTTGNQKVIIFRKMPGIPNALWLRNYDSSP